jgi:hypothetical protein
VGGGIYNAGTLTVSDSYFSRNTPAQAKPRRPVCAPTAAASKQSESFLAHTGRKWSRSWKENRYVTVHLAATSKV